MICPCKSCPLKGCGALHDKCKAFSAYRGSKQVGSNIMQTVYKPFGHRNCDRKKALCGKRRMGNDT